MSDLGYSEESEKFRKQMSHAMAIGFFCALLYGSGYGFARFWDWVEAKQVQNAGK